MPIDRTAFDAMVDDSGSGTDGTIWDKAAIVDAILDPIDDALATTAACIDDTGDLSFAARSELTIATGAVVVTLNVHSVDTESNAASDDLDTLTAGTSVRDHHFLILQPESASRVVTVKHNTGNIKLTRGHFVMNDANHRLVLYKDGSSWYELARSAKGPFIGLSDVPTSYSGSGGKAVAVKGDASGLEFVSFPTSGVTASGTPADNQVAVWTSASAIEGASSLIFDGNSLYLNDTSNALSTKGLTLNQGINDDEIIAFKSSDIAHGMTDLTETDTYGSVTKIDGDAGGYRFLGLTEATRAFQLWGNSTTDDTSHTASGAAVVMAKASKKSGTSVGANGANANLFAVADHTNTRFIVDAEGDTFQDGTAGTAYSDYDDPMLALAVEHHINPKQQVRAMFARYCQYNKQSLIDAGILAPDGPDGSRGFVNMSALTRLNTGAAWQIGIELRRLKQALLSSGVVTAAQLEG